MSFGCFLGFSLFAWGFKGLWDLQKGFTLQKFFFWGVTICVTCLSWEVTTETEDPYEETKVFCPPTGELLKNPVWDLQALQRATSMKCHRPDPVDTNLVTVMFWLVKKSVWRRLNPM